ncbi:MAG: hypothetical protein LBM04_01210, partial [Opitutaceae bacterium]|nr:hypothetical protein [Opitutaceae bacterium]
MECVEMSGELFATDLFVSCAGLEANANRVPWQDGKRKGSGWVQEDVGGCGRDDGENEIPKFCAYFYFVKFDKRFRRSMSFFLARWRARRAPGTPSSVRVLRGM